MKITEKRTMIFISCIMAVLILVQHHYVYMYFDDYGYASLSYAGIENSAGMSYGLSEIFHFLKVHYLSWGGRILYFFFEIVIFRVGGLPLMQIFQAIIIILIGIISGKIVSCSTNSNSYKCIALTMVLYGMINIKTLRDGVLWYSASVLYVWPMLPFLGSIYLYLCNEKKEAGIKRVMCILLAFLAAFSQEQIAVLTIAFYMLIVIFKIWKKDKMVPKYLYGVCISAFIGGALTIFAPGNMVRARSGIYDEFYSKSILSRAINNIGYIINDNVGLYNCFFVFFLTIFIGTAIALFLNSRAMTVITTVFAFCLMAECFISVPKEAGVIVGGLWLIIFIPLLVLYYYRQRKFCFLSLLIAGICTQAMMIVSPAVPLRLHTIFEFILHILLAECIVYLYRKYRESKKRRLMLEAGVVIMTIYAVCNMTLVITGYRNNYEINQSNNQELLAVREQYKDGKIVERVVLHKLKNDIYAQMMPYQEGYEFIETWMKKYYELPEGVIFEWM